MEYLFAAFCVVMVLIWIMTKDENHFVDIDDGDDYVPEDTQLMVQSKYIEDYDCVKYEVDDGTGLALGVGDTLKEALGDWLIKNQGYEGYVVMEVKVHDANSV